MFDPNPQVAGWKAPEVRRLHWTTEKGAEVFGDLITPPGRSAVKAPLIIVQYRTRGFLRGGTGDEVPILAFPAAGLAVLSIDAPESVGVTMGAKTWDEVNRVDHTDWADRKSIGSAIDRGIDLAIATGQIDGAHLGITGLSDGASTVQYALIHSRRFAAATMGTCCDEPYVINVLNSGTGADWFHSMGYPTIGHPDANFWKPMSFVANAQTVDTPILMQLPDREYLGAIESIAALRDQQKPIEVFVFPDEYHVKWQPAHRLTVYTRNLDWFKYWLLNERDDDLAKQTQYARWDRLRSLRTPKPAGAPGK